MGLKAMVLAAGQGTRLRPLTEQLPKPMVSVGGKPLLEYNIQLLRQHGIRDIAINVHHRLEVIQEHFGNGSRWGVRITYSLEPELLGTAGAVKRMEGFFTDRFLVLYGDNLTNCDLTRLIAFHESKGGIGTIAMHWRDDPTSSGMVEMNEDGRIRRFVEKPKPHEVFSHWVNAGLLVLEPGVLDYIAADRPSDFGRDVLPALITAGCPLYGYRMSEGLWWIDTLEDYQHLQELAEKGGLRLP